MKRRYKVTCKSCGGRKEHKWADLTGVHTEICQECGGTGKVYNTYEAEEEFARLIKDVNKLSIYLSEYGVETGLTYDDKFKTTSSSAKSDS